LVASKGVVKSFLCLCCKNKAQGKEKVVYGNSGVCRILDNSTIDFVRIITPKAVAPASALNLDVGETISDFALQD
jgi:hypothetical protein